MTDHPPSLSASAAEPWQIRAARADEHAAVGQLMVTVYSALADFPTPQQQPRYYDMLANIGQMTTRPGVQLLVAEADGELLGAVVYFADMAQYGSGGIATTLTDAAGFRLLAVSPAAQGRGVGRALMASCIALAVEQGRQQLVIHSTRAMRTAWGMYERHGFRHAEELDFMQESLAVYGFRLRC